MLKMDFRSISMDTGMPIQVEFTAFFRGFETLSKMEEKSIGTTINYRYDKQPNWENKEN